jgi:NADPH-dependent 2,4-dienoyl-CoA reductase/sulfur reductase-like enzyme
MTVDRTWLPERVDVLVVGGGMAGLAAAMVAAENGARVLVIEKGSRPGGSAALSVGMFWAVPDVETLRRRVPLGHPDLGRRGGRRRVVELDVRGRAGTGVHHRPKGGGVHARRPRTGSEVRPGAPSIMAGVSKETYNLARA